MFNGEMGTITAIDEREKRVTIKFDDEKVALYTYQDLEQIEHSYAITIHKAQGMTLDKLFVDCSRIFEKGQIYVALSRIRTLNGLFLKNFNPYKIKIDDKVIEFYKQIAGDK
mgnify:CR=1 FL=1